MASTTLEVVGTVTGLVTLNPIVLGAIAGLGVLLHAYVAASDIS